MSGPVESLLVQLLEEQRQTNHLLAMLIESNQQMIEAMADGDDCGDMPESMSYLDGSPVRS